MKLLHTMIRVADIEKSLKFYTELLDMKVVEKRWLEDCWLYFLSDETLALINTCGYTLMIFLISDAFCLESISALISINDVKIPSPVGL